MSSMTQMLRQQKLGEVVQADLAAIDRLDAEDIAVFCWSDVRPLAGAAGIVDWRLCGALSRTLEQRFFEGRRAEVMLLAIGGRGRLRRVFVFGLGPAEGASDSVLKFVCRQAFDVLTQAGVKRLVFAAPATHSRGKSAGDAREAAFLRAASEELPGRIDVVLVGQAG